MLLQYCVLHFHVTVWKQCGFWSFIYITCYFALNVYYVWNLNIWSFPFISEKNISDYRMKLTLFILNAHINLFLTLVHSKFLPLCWVSSIDPAPCSFPFIYRNKSYYSCTTEGILFNQLWCATTANYDDDNKWKSCSLQGKGARSNCLEYLWVISNPLLVWRGIIEEPVYSQAFPSVPDISSTFCGDISVCHSSPEAQWSVKDLY